MPNFNITGPDGHNYSFSAPEGTSQVDALKFAELLYQQRKASLQTAGIGEAFKGGAKRMLGSLETAVESPFTGEKSAVEGLARQEAITEKSGASLEKVKSIYNEKGLLPAAREAISQIPSAIAEQAPQLATALGGARLGAMAGSAFGPAGTVIGGLGGAFAPSLIQSTGSNIERRQQEGKPFDLASSFGAAVPQAALDVFTDKLLFGKLMGIPAKALGRAEADAVVAQSLKRTLAEGTAKGVAAEVPTEVAQQMLERYQAGLSLTDDEARKEYADTAYQTALLGPLGAIGKVQERGDAKQVIAQDEAARAAAVAQAQRRATGTMDQQPLFTPQEAPVQEQLTPEVAPISTVVPEPTTTPPTFGFNDEGKFVNEPAPEVSPDQGDLFTRKGAPTKDALASVEAARLQGLPAKIQELLQTPEGRAELAGNIKMYFPDLDVKERNKTRQAIQQGTYGVEPVAPAEGTLTPEILKTFGITPRSKQYKALEGGNLADPTTYNLLTVAAATNTDFGVKANRILEAFPQYKPSEESATPTQPKPAEVVNEQPQPQDVQPDLFGVQPNGIPDTTEQQGTEQGMGVPVQPAETTPEEAPEPVGPRVDGDSGVPQPNVGAVGPSTAGQPSALAPVPKKVARDAAAALKKEPVATTWGYLSDIPFAKLSKVAKDKVKDAHAQGYLNQELADEIERIEAGNARATAAGKAITPETPLDDTPVQGLTAEAAALPDIEAPLLLTENKQIEDLKNKSVLEVAKWFSTNAPSKSYRIIANILANRFAEFEKAGATYSFKLTNTLKGGTRGQCNTSIDNRTGELEVKVSIQDSSVGKTYEVVLHELIHAGVDSAIGVAQLARKRGKTIPGYAKYVDQISAVAKETKKVIGQRVANRTANEFEIRAYAKNNNAFANEFEFVTWGLTNPDMQATLESIPMGTQGKTLWSEFVTVIRNLLGIPASANTALSELLSASEGLLNTPYTDIKGAISQYSSITTSQINPQTETPAFKKWFGDSKIVNADGTPKVGYHTTVGDFDVFNKDYHGSPTVTQKLGLSFVSFDKNWVNKFGSTSDADIEHVRTYGDGILELSKHNGRNIMPVFIKAEKPFDFENPNHVRHLTHTILGLDARRVADGSWAELESKRVIDFLKANGYDGMYVSERGAKNLAVFEPNQLKSAVGNKGTFNATDNIITNQIDSQTETPAFKKWFGNSKVVDKEGNPLVIYHGTNKWTDATNNVFKPSFSGTLGEGFYFTDDADKASDFAMDIRGERTPETTPEGGNVVPVYLKMVSPVPNVPSPEWQDWIKNKYFRGFDQVEKTYLPGHLAQMKAMKPEQFEHAKKIYAKLNNNTASVTDLFSPVRTSYGLENVEWGHDLSAQLRKAGYDGLIVPVPEKGMTEYVVFEPNQIKSAIGNKGTFDATDTIITNQIDPQAQAQANQFIAGMSGTLARSVPTQTTTPAQAAQNFVSTVYRNPNDALGMIEGMANRIRTSAIDKAAHLSASIQDHNDGAFYDVNGQMRADLKLSAANNTNNYINSVFAFGDIDILPNGAIEVKQGTHSVDNIFRHAKTLADRIGVEQMRKLVTDSFYHYRAKAIIDNISPDKWPENWQKDPRMVPTQAQINAAMAAFNTFPELRAMQNEFIGSKNQMVKFLRKAGFLTAEKTRAFLADDSYAPWLRLKEYQDVMPGLGNMGKMVDLSQMKALVGGTEEVNDMLENMSQMIGWCVRSGISNHTANSALDTMSSMGTAVRHAGRPGTGNPAHVVMTYVDGKPTFWTVDNPYDLAAFQSVKGLNSPVMRAIGKGLGTLRAGIVLFPAFPLRQVVMDSQRAFVEAGVKNPWSMVGKIYSSFLSGEAFRGQHQDIQKLMQHGVVGGADFTAMDTTRGRATQFGIGEEAKTITDKWVRSPAYNFLHKLAYSADLAVRLGIYRQTLEETGDETLAATKAREIINFQKAGTSELMHTLKQTIPFLGAYLQGMDVNYRGMVGRGNSMQARKAAAKAYWGNMAMYAGLTIAYTMAMSGDDEYEDQKGYVTDHNFLIPGGGLLPIPPDVGFLAKVVPERITDYILQEGTDSPESARRLRQGLLQSFAAGYMPPAAVYGVTPAIELMLNKSFFSDMPIVSQRMQGLDPRFQYTASTSEIAKEIGDITGQSPLQIDYLFNAIGGTSAGALLQLADVAFGSGKMAPDKTPIISSFQQKTVGGRNAEEYYALREMSDRAYNTVQALALEQNPEKLQAYLADPKKQQLYAMHQGIESLHAQLNQVSRIRNIIEKDPNLSPEEKRQKVNELLANVEATLRAMPIRKQRAELE